MERECDDWARVEGEVVSSNAARSGAGEGQGRVQEEGGQGGQGGEKGEEEAEGGPWRARGRVGRGRSCTDTSRVSEMGAGK